MPDFTVVTINTNQKELTAMWLASILKHTNEPINILIGENNSNDGSKEYFSRFDGKTIKQSKISILHSDETLELGKFLDILKAKVETPVMAIIHNDGELKRDIWHGYLKKEFEKNNNLAVISSGFKPLIRNHKEPTGKIVHLQSDLCSNFLVYRMEYLNKLATSFEPVYIENTGQLYDVGAKLFEDLRKKEYDFLCLPWWFAKGASGRINNFSEKVAGLFGLLVYEHYVAMSYFHLADKKSRFYKKKLKKLELLKRKFKEKHFLKRLNKEIKELFV